MTQRSGARGHRDCRYKHRLKVSCALAAILLATAVGAAEPVPYQIEPSNGSRFALEVFKTGLMRGKKHLFEFERYKGRLDYDAQAPERSRVTLQIEAASAVLKDDWVSANDFKKIEKEAFEKMMAVDRYPQLTFVSRNIRSEEAGRYQMEGDLTIRETPKPVMLEVTLKPQSGGVLLVEGQATVKLKDYGLKPPSAALGLIGTQNEMTVAFTLRARPAP